jgi:Na+-driven multidrug efflux pump
VAFALDGILVGAGDQRFLALAMVASSLVLVGAMVVVWPASVGLGAVWAGFTVFMATRVGLLGWRWRTGRWVHLGAVAR